MNSRILIVILILSFTSCNPQKLPVQEFAIESGGVTIAVINAEVARTQAERNRGLMFRKDLADGEGMLFIFETDHVLSFWMKNTIIPLSIAFITHDGRIVDIKNMYPKDINTVSSSRSARYALEVPQGWFSRVGVKEGDIVNVKNLR